MARVTEPVDYAARFPLRSLLADAGIPMGATVTHIYRARHWKSLDAKNGRGYARRLRIRSRKRRRESWTYEHRAIEFKPHTIVLGRSGGWIA
jgi:hypothetical protein